MPRPLHNLQPQRVLIVKPSAMGDIVHALPVAALLKRRWPSAHVAWVVSRPFAPLLETNPHVDELLAFDRERGGRVLAHSENARRLSRQVRGGAFDLVIDLQGLFRSAWLAWQSRAAVRVGFADAREAAPLFYTHRVSARTPLRHAVERNLDIAEFLGLGRSPVEFPLLTTEGDEAAVESLLAAANGEGFAVLLPGTNWPTKRWPASSFAALAARLEPELGLRPVIAGGPDALEAAAEIHQAAPAALNLVGRTSARELVALLRRASLVVCNDSGPMHIAAALGVPLVAPFGPTSPFRTGPYARGEAVVRLDIVCSPCFSRRCAHQSCLRLLDLEPVLSRCRQVLQRLAVTAAAR